MIELLLAILAERRARFGPGNDELWGPGNWVECAQCPDSFGFPAFHHRLAHDGPELAYVRDRLAEVYQPEGIELWLRAPNRVLHGMVPRDLIRAGRADEVLDLIEALATGAVL
jgi:hypothetical protein